MIRLFFTSLILLFSCLSVHASGCDRASDFSTLTANDFCDDDLVNKNFPKFESYKVKKTEAFTKGELLLRVASNDLDSLGDESDVDAWRTAINKAYSSEGANFAGHYLIAQRGFNGDTHSAVLINLLTGKFVKQNVLLTVVNDVHFISESGLRKIGFLSDSTFSYKKNSTLLIVKGASGEDAKKHGIYYFNLVNDKLKLIKKFEKDTAY